MAADVIFQKILDTIEDHGRPSCIYMHVDSMCDLIRAVSRDFDDDPPDGMFMFGIPILMSGDVAPDNILVEYDND